MSYGKDIPDPWERPKDPLLEALPSQKHTYADPFDEFANYGKQMGTSGPIQFTDILGNERTVPGWVVLLVVILGLVGLIIFLAFIVFMILFIIWDGYLKSACHAIITADCPPACTNLGSRYPCNA